MAAERRLRVMGSDAHLVVDGPESLLDRAAERLNQLESRWSRFLPDSEVTRLNDRCGRSVVVSRDTVTLVSRAIEAWHVTAGSFDPTVLGDVVRTGYDRTFSEISGRPGASPLTRGAGSITLAGASVMLPPGVGFDPGGIGKGLAADLVASELLTWGARSACVNVGGDVRVAGHPSAGAPWRIAVDHPWDAHPLAVVPMIDGAVATSSVVRRVWGPAERPSHHLINPWTGRSLVTTLATVTVVAAHCWQGEALTKAVFLAPAAHRFALVERLGASALAVDRDGAVTTSPGWSRVTERNAA